jgi:hypothetical protein
MIGPITRITRPPSSEVVNERSPVMYLVTAWRLSPAASHSRTCSASSRKLGSAPKRAATRRTSAWASAT